MFTDFLIWKFRGVFMGVCRRIVDISLDRMLKLKK